jgi:hypothetical protein
MQLAKIDSTFLQNNAGNFRIASFKLYTIDEQRPSIFCVLEKLQCVANEMKDIATSKIAEWNLELSSS